MSVVFRLASERPLLAVLLLLLMLGIAFVIAVTVTIQKLEQVQIVLSRFMRVLARLGIWTKRQKQFDIEGHVNLGVKNIQNASLGGLDIPTVRLEWVDVDDGANDFDDGVLILRMNRDVDNVENINRVALAVAKDGVIRDASSYVSDAMERGLELSVARTVLKEMGHPLALRHFTSRVLREVLENSEIKNTFARLEAIEEGGLFSRCLLLELAELTAKMHPHRIKDDLIVAETRDFADFVYRYVVRDYEEQPGLDFIGEYISMSFVIIAKQETIEAKGHKPYVKATLNCFSRGVNSVYLSAFGKTAQEAREIASVVVKYGKDPDTGVPVLHQTGERAFSAMYQGVRRHVLLTRLSRVRPAQRLSETATPLFPKLVPTSNEHHLP